MLNFANDFKHERSTCTYLPNTKEALQHICEANILVERFMLLYCFEIQIFLAFLTF